MQAIKIAVADSRKSKQWQNREIKWEDFAEQCSRTKRTNETLEGYRAMTKAQQSGIKDVGGFVGGHLITDNGPRKRDNIALRSLITLDIDHGLPGVWEKLTASYTGAMLCYSTHKHTPEAPRLRIVVPLCRDVTPAEYEPLSRKFCQVNGLLELIDCTTHDLNRLFYWPSTSRDAEFYFMQQAGDALDVDAVLSQYSDPQNRAEWPRSPYDPQQLREAAQKAGDPTEKPGLIGAFCRTYSIEDTIEKFLSDVYDKTATEGRYTYKKGSVAGGLVCYESKYAYSHHETDPASMKLCNAFDLVRLHKFGELDKEAKTGTPVNRLPSFLKMSDLCINDPETKQTIMTEKLKGAADDFAGIDCPNDDWLTDLDCDRKGNVLNSPGNLRLIILNDDVLKSVRYDMFARKDIAEAEQLKSAEGNNAVNDEVLGKISIHIGSRYRINIGIKSVREMLVSTRRERGFNPVIDFITSTQWDGVMRVETLLIDYLGALDNAANREVTRKWMTAAVARVFEPGRAFQNVLTLPGPQGIGKSTFLQVLAGDEKRFCDNLCLSDNDVKRNEATEGAWIVELNELNGISRSEWQPLKAYISRRQDKGYKKYAYTRSDESRRYVLAATTNGTAFLREADKGNRRWWVVPVNGIKEPVRDWMKRLADEMPQIWAEAYHYYKAGEDICNLSETTAEYMAEKQWDYSEDADDPMPGMIEEYLNTLLPVDWATWPETNKRAYFRDRDPLAAVGTMRRDRVCADMYLSEFEGVVRANPRIGAMRRKVNAIMRKNPNWVEKSTITFYPPYGRQRGFVRRPTAPDNDDI